LIQQPEPIVIIGTGLAGYSVVREFRKLDSKSGVVMLTVDDGASYSKPMLSNGFAKGKSARELAMADAGQMVKQLRVEIRTYTEVTGIDTTQNMVLIGNERLRYRKLVIAAGADVTRLELRGTGLGHVYSVNNLLDYHRIRKALEGWQRVAILGAGLIGCEFANDLLLGSYQPDIIAPCTSVLPGLLPPPVGKALEQGLAEAGVNFHLERFAKEIRAAKHGVDVVLDNDDVIAADLVLSAVGLQPRKRLAEQAGIRCATGIAVNRKLETSADDIYALGDCAEVDGHCMFYVLPLMASAKALAKTLAGEITQVSYGVMPVTVKTPACPVIVCPPVSQASGEWQITTNSAVDVSAKFTNAQGQLLGFALSGKAVAEKQSLIRQMPPVHS
jgi:rubredoxin---NAD+ reductase